MSADRTPSSRCPKDMVYGPCGGVRANGDCELPYYRCPFALAVVERPPADPVHRSRPVDFGTALIDLQLPRRDDDLQRVADVVNAAGATVLVGEHVDDPSGSSPHRHAERLAAVDLRGVVTVTGRTRSVDEHVTEICRLVEAGVAAVHCVTGDHPAVRMGPDRTATFSLDGTRLAEHARTTGVTVSVSESPAATPTIHRPARVAIKERAGADVVILNHAGAPTSLVEFADRCREAGARLAMVAPVPVITDRTSARSLAQFPGLVLPDGLVERVLGSCDPFAAGIDAAVEIGRELMESGRFATINLSGAGANVGAVERVELMASIAEMIAA